MGFVERFLIEEKEEIDTIHGLYKPEQDLDTKRCIGESNGIVDEIADVFKVGRFGVMPVSIELTVFAASKVVCVCECARNPQHAHGELKEQLDLDHEQRIEEITVSNEWHEREEDVVAKVDDGSEKTKDDEEDEGTPRRTDDGVMVVVVSNDEDADDSGGEGEETDQAGDEESDDEHDVGVRCAGDRVVGWLGHRQ